MSVVCRSAKLRSCMHHHGFVDPPWNAVVFATSSCSAKDISPMHGILRANGFLFIVFFVQRTDWPSNLLLFIRFNISLTCALARTHEECPVGLAHRV